MKKLLSIIAITILMGLYSLSSVQAQMSSLWKITSGVLSPVVSTWQLYSPGDFRFDDEILPDGNICANGQILKRTGADNWDCATDETGAGGSGSMTTVKEDGVQLGGADIVTLDFLGADFNLTETPDTEVNIVINDGGIDHGALAGLSDDDHTIYTLADGTRAFTGTQTFNENIEMKDDKKLYFDTAKSRYIEYNPAIGSLVLGDSNGLSSVGGLLLSSNCGADGLGSYEPFLFFQSDGSVAIHNELEGVAAARFFHITMNAGIRLSTTGSGGKFAILKADNIATADKTFQFPNYSGTFITSGNLTDITTVGTIAAGTWNGTSIADANVDNNITVTGYMQDTDIDTFAELQAWAVGYTDNNTTYVSSDFTHDDLTGFVANEHLDWTSDLGAVNINAGNYTDTNTTYLGGTNLTLAGTTFNVDDAFVINSGSDIIGGGSGFTHTFNASAGSDSVFTFGDGTVNLSTGALQVGGVAVLTGNQSITLSGDVAGSGATAITTTIGADKILESHLKAVDAAADEECLTYEATTGDFEWQACGGSLAINDVTDITIDTPADNEVLAYNNGTSTWLNQTPAEAGLQGVLTNSAGLLAALNDETGTGLSVFSTSPTFTTGITVPNDSISAAELNEGDAFVFTGSVAVPQGGPTIDGVGEIGVDTTSDQFLYYGASKRVVPYYHEKCFTIEDIADADDNVPIWSPNKAITITDVYCRTQGGTSAVITISDGTNALEAVTCDADGQADDGSITNGAFTANERMEFDTGTVTGAVDWTNFCITYTITAD